MNDILHCIFNVQHYQLIKVCDNYGERNLETLHEPIGNQFDRDKALLGILVDKAISSKKDWVSAWGFSYMAYCFPDLGDDHYLLIINNKNDYWLEKEHNWSISSICSKVGQSLLRIKRKNNFDRIESAFKYADDDIRVFDSQGFVTNMNSVAAKNIEMWRSSSSSLLSEENIRHINQNLTSSEVWQAKNTSTKLIVSPAYMEINAFPYRGTDDSEHGVIAISRDVSFQHNLLATIMRFPNAKNEQEVYNILLEGIIKQSALRIRVYMPENGNIYENGNLPTMVGKYCRGYENKPEIQSLFKKEAIDTIGYEATLEYLEWKKNGKPCICRINEEYKNEPKLTEDSAFYVYEMSERFDSHRKELDKEQTNEWLYIGLFTDNHIFAMLSIDKGNNGKPFRAVECNRMITICQAAEMALVRIKALDVAKMVRMFRHSVSQQITAVSHFMWTVAESDLPRDEREIYAETVDEVLQRFEQFNRTLLQWMPENNDELEVEDNEILLEKLLLESVIMFKYYCKTAKIELVLDNLLPSNHTIVSNIVLLQTTLFNLLANAFKSLENQNHHKEVIIRCDGSDKNVRISVIDNGSGVPEEKFNRIFEMGYSGTKDGSGIGLPTCKLIAAKLGGRMMLDRKFIDGAKFDFVIPIYSKKDRKTNDVKFS